jgi:uncharacterized protein YbcV (DUF1398 family)
MFRSARSGTPSGVRRMGHLPGVFGWFSTQPRPRATLCDRSAVGKPQIVGWAATSQSQCDSLSGRNDDLELILTRACPGEGEQWLDSAYTAVRDQQSKSRSSTLVSKRADNEQTMKRRIVNVIKESTKGAIDGTLTFREAVARLIAIGVSHYHIDFLRSENTTYMADGESHVGELPPSGVQIGGEFSASEVAAAAKAFQGEGLPFQEFSSRVRKAGCIGYVAYLEGQRVVYSGSRGDEHVEPFLR